MMDKFEFKLRKLIGGKLFGNFKSFFKGDGLEVSDFRKYEIGDDLKTVNWKLSAKHDSLFINLFQKEKDLSVDLFFDYNLNWLGGTSSENYDKIIEKYLDIFLLCKKYGAKLSIFYFDKEKKKIIKERIFDNKFLAYRIIHKIRDNLKSINYKYSSNLVDFLNIQKKITKKHVIVLFSDMLELDDSQMKIIKSLALKNTLFIHKVELQNIYGLNYNLFLFKKNKFLESKDLDLYLI